MSEEFSRGCIRHIAGLVISDFDGQRRIEEILAEGDICRAAVQVLVALDHCVYAGTVTDVDASVMYLGLGIDTKSRLQIRAYCEGGGIA